MVETWLRAFPHEDCRIRKSASQLRLGISLIAFTIPTARNKESRDTDRLFSGMLDVDAVEWDYGAYEGVMLQVLFPFATALFLAAK